MCVCVHVQASVCVHVGMCMCVRACVCVCGWVGEWLVMDGLTISRHIVLQCSVLVYRPIPTIITVKVARSTYLCGVVKYFKDKMSMYF